LKGGAKKKKERVVNADVRREEASQGGRVKKRE